MMRRTGVYEWTLQCEAKSLERGSAYKYVLVMDDDHSRKVVWEEGGNRYLPTAPHPTADIDADHARMVVHDDMPRIAFERWRGAGIVIPVFSLRSEGSQGRRKICWAPFPCCPSPTTVRAAATSATCDAWWNGPRRPDCAPCRCCR